MTDPGVCDSGLRLVLPSARDPGHVGPRTAPTTVTVRRGPQRARGTGDVDDVVLPTSAATVKGGDGSGGTE